MRRSTHLERAQHAKLEISMKQVQQAMGSSRYVQRKTIFLGLNIYWLKGKAHVFRFIAVSLDVLLCLMTHFVSRPKLNRRVPQYSVSIHYFKLE